MKLKNIISKWTYVVALCAFGLSQYSCDDFLEREPLDRVTPELFLNSENDLASYPIAYYGSIFPTHGGWSTGIGRFDDHTDNQATSNASYGYYVPGEWKVPASGGLGLGNIRDFNWFFEQVLPKWRNGAISGNEANIDHYIGEVYMLRAMENFDFLKRYGDFPIIRNTVRDVHGDLVEAAKRAPRNEFARFILSDLDSAIMLLNNTGNNKVRLTKNAALLAKSRVALFEGTFLKYHKGTPRVPGGPNWPGADMPYNSGFSINIDSEIDYFLTQAMAAAKEVADGIDLTVNSGQLNPDIASSGAVNPSGWNPYFEMFGSRNMGSYPEILFWRDYDLELNITHGVSIYIERGANTGLTRGFVDGFLMKNGLPIYAAGSGFQGDVTIMDAKEDRDERLQLFLAGEEDLMESISKAGSSNIDSVAKFGVPTLLNLEEVRDITGYRSRKFLNYELDEAPGSDLTCTAGSPIFRVAEAYLNYIEASYVKNNTIDATADKYWRAIRSRAGITEDYNVTIGATDLSQENDWGVYSAGVPVDETLFNIRRERRNEFVSEGMRMNDLKRWRAMDQVKDYVIEGFNLWDQAYDDDLYKDEDGNSLLISDGGSTANVSAQSLGTHLRPYQKVIANNEVYNGYTWSKANYLSPISFRELQLASPDQVSVENSNLYQNPYWPSEPGASALE
ncbi:Starch-binding associating with outer membrane [Saccharicrinis carchari]|uniref:Starch-binding associating with outer membrane n=1 Tax=Saccharicrinis carchari TaxID=1168039 RepID=A0A521B384_SACCC|nr:RagB/SusD family nutrient uptake outer membrane protein [Saccharicrinis carchari]SMO41543.1 Starch-binding associating with outer membrane [Saccharicrinis carchari]